MPATNSGFFSEYRSASNLKKDSVVVVWRAHDNDDLSDDEKESLIALLKSELEKSMAFANLDRSSVQLRAAITRVETVSPALNWLTTIILFIPLDRGGVAVEFQAIDNNTHKPIAQLSFAEWTPLSKFTARYKRLAPAKLALATAVTIN